MTRRSSIRKSRVVLVLALVSCAGGRPPAGDASTNARPEARQGKDAAGPQESADSEKPRVLHLRSERFRFRFDAPDDSWLAIGPRTRGDAQFVWIWSDGRRQIDVQALDLTMAPPNHPGEAIVAEKMADSLRTKGAHVVIVEAVLAGSPCHHLVVDREDGWKQEMFILHHAKTNYSILITQRTRDVGLIDRVRAGFSLVDR